MKSIIRDVRVEVVPWRHPVHSFSRTSEQKEGYSELGIVRILTEDGIEGIGEAAAERALAEIRAELSPAQTHAHAHVS